MKAITFLGASIAHPTTYIMGDGREHTAQFCGVALAHFYPALEMRVFVTPDARKMHLNDFLIQVESVVADIQPIDIPDGANEDQLWQVFETVIDAVDNEEQVVFDITHGYRSLPFLSFLAAAYLRVVKKIDLVALLYGNFEARDKSVTPNRAPIIDMTPFVGLLDWMIEADRFIRFGDAQGLAAQLRTAHTKSGGSQNKPLTLAANTLVNVSRALQLIRPLDAMSASNDLSTVLSNAVVTLPENARPFLALTQSITDAYAPLALGKEKHNNITTALATERNMVQWYVERKQYVQAVAIAREWLVTWLMARLGFTNQLATKDRKQVENALGQLIQSQKNDGRSDTHHEESSLDLSSIPQISEAVIIYNQLGDLRNDLLHAGKRLQPFSAETLEKNICKYCKQLEKLTLSLD